MNATPTSVASISTADSALMRSSTAPPSVVRGDLIVPLAPFAERPNGSVGASRSGRLVSRKLRSINRTAAPKSSVVAPPLTVDVPHSRRIIRGSSLRQ